MDTNKIEKEIMNLIMKYGEEHKLAIEVGSEYIFQNDEARIDAEILVGDIFDIISQNNN